MKGKESKLVNGSPVAAFLTAAINSCSKSQLQIAAEVGFPTPNIITMLKQGRTKLPLTKVKALADSLDTDPKVLLKMCFEEYQPENWAAIQDIFGVKL